MRIARSTPRPLFVPTIVVLATASTLVACSSSSSPTPIKAAPIVGNGKHYTVAGASVAQSRWPDPCALLPQASGAAALGTQVTVKRFHENCFYVPDSAAFANLSITLQGVGTDLADRFDALGQAAATRKLRSVPNVGREAFSYPATVQPTTTLVVRCAGAVFSVALTTAVGAAMPAAREQATLIAVAKPIVDEFSA